MRLNITYPDKQPGLVQHLEKLDVDIRAARYKMYAEFGYMCYLNEQGTEMLMSRLEKGGVIEELKQQIKKQLYAELLQDLKTDLQDTPMEIIPGGSDDLSGEPEDFMLDTDSLVMAHSGP